MSFDSRKLRRYYYVSRLNRASDVAPRAPARPMQRPVSVPGEVTG